MNGGFGRDRGVATAEVAVVLPSLVVLVAAGMSAISVLTAQLRCVDAAREGARAAAQGEGIVVVRSVAGRSGPAGADIQVACRADEVRVTVAADARPVGGLLPWFRVHATAVALREPESTGAS